MTIVELFDERPINNVVGTVAFSPDKVIYVGGDAAKQFEKYKLPVLRRYFDRKGFTSLEIEYVQVKRDSLRDIIEKLEGIYAANNDLRFDVEVTGGEDLILIGLGVICQRHPEIELYQISSRLRSLRAFSVSSDDGRKLDVTCTNTVEENLLLHGASIISADGSDSVPGGYVWTVEFMRDVMLMWDACSKGIKEGLAESAPTAWNKTVSQLGALDAEQGARADRNRITIASHYFRDHYLNGDSGDLLYEYLCFFIRSNLLDCRVEADYTYIEFKNDQIRQCLTKAGLLLELKIYMICSELLGPRGGDCHTSVTVDWDGDDDFSAAVKFRTDPDDPDSTVDTTNEIDVAAICGLTPYFISCKNGIFNQEELYKLYSVCERFGGGYGKKILVATNSSYSLGSARPHLLQRAADMGIQIIENVHEKNDDELAAELALAMELPKAKLPTA